MKHLLTITILVFIVAGCSSAPPQNEVVSNAANAETPHSTFSGSTGMDNAVTDNSATEQPTTALQPMSITAGPPMLPVLITTMPSEGWQSFTSTSLGVTMDYPSDWSVIEQTDGVTFTSPRGKTIQLQVITTSSDNADSGNNNRQCATLINKALLFVS